MTNDLATGIYICIYVFGVIPVIGQLFGGNYCTYGNDDAYQNCMYRGIVVHAIIAAVCLVVWATYHKLFGE